jgi:UDP-N-acetyl-D-mannosaminuronate dehydrogenase
MARPSALDYTATMRVLIIGCGYVGLPLGSELAAARIKFPE